MSEDAARHDDAITQSEDGEIQSHRITVEVTREEMVEELEEWDEGLLNRAITHIECAEVPDMGDWDPEERVDKAFRMLALWHARQQEEYDL